MNDNLKDLHIIIEKLESCILKENFKGYDPFDGLMSPIFKLPILKSNKLLRFGFQQVFRRIPFNLRPLLGIKKGLNPVTLGLSIQSFTYLSQVFLEKKDFYQKQIDYCFVKLDELKSNGYSGTCWGYDFDWEARYAKIPAFTPTVVATGFITNALYEYYIFSKNEKAKELILSSVDFVLNDLNKTFDDEGNFCFSYSPNDNQVVFNATMKGARLLTQAYSILPNENLKNEIIKTVNFVMKYQTKEGYWSYSSGDARTWVDNFHTAYVLDALKVVNENFDNLYFEQFEKGLNYYVNTFFENSGETKYYSHKLYPIDATQIAQSIITLVENNYFELADKVLNYGIKNIYSGRGYFYYQKHSLFTNKISYMRWSNAWIFLALTFYFKREIDENYLV